MEKKSSENESNRIQKKTGRSFCFLALLLLAACLITVARPRTASAAATGFQTINGKGYYINQDGSKYKGWKSINGKKYLFDFETGEQVIGWQKDKWGNYLRYFSRALGSKGYMATGLWQDGNGNVRYFDPSTGLMTKGWYSENGNHRYFDTTTGIMYTGIRKVGNYYYYFVGNSDPAKAGFRCKAGFVTLGSKRYYFSPTDGRRATGWLTVDGKTYYFGSDGVQYTGVRKVGKYYYYFQGSQGVMYQGGFRTLGGYQYYFNPKDGHGHIGWLTLNGKKYYFDSKGHMYVNTTLNLGGKKYHVDESGVVTEGTYTYKTESNYVYAYDSKNGRYYYLAKEFATHPGIADGTKTDRDILAALVDAEAGDQGLVGMEAVAMCVLNRTLKTDKEFPSDIRFVIYQQSTASSYPQYSPVRDGSLLKRLNGQFSNKTLAYQAVDEAMKIFNAYVNNKTPRKLDGFDRDDFNFMYFMSESSFYKQPLNFSKVDSYLYKDHMFFVDWV
jgi:glucan-binding YG repeat protein